MNFLRSKS